MAGWAIARDRPAKSAGRKEMGRAATAVWFNPALDGPREFVEFGKERAERPAQGGVAAVRAEGPPGLHEQRPHRRNGRRLKRAIAAKERLPFLPPFAPAADTCARTTVESNIWMRCAVELIEASVSKKASKTPALLKRSKRFHMPFQGPKRPGRARQRTFSTVKKCSASRKRRSSCASLPRRGRQARNTGIFNSSAC
jgi:hypothetical protein